MADAESQFNLDALQEAIERMKPDLRVASEAAHKHLDKTADDDEDRWFDRIVQVGFLHEVLTDLCGADIAVMVQIAQALHDVHCDAPEEDHHMHRSPQETTQH